MKTSYIVGIIVVVLIAGGLILKGIGGTSAPEAMETTTVMDATSTPIILTSIHSDVFAKTTANASGQMVTTSVTLTEKDGVKTGATGRALLENNDLKTIIDHDSEVSISELKSKQAHLSMNSGSVWLRVEKVFGIGEGVEVETPNAIAAVRGTSFGLSYKNGVTTLLVGEGTVGLVGKDGTTGTTSPEVLVHKNEKGIVGLDGKVKVSSLTDSDKKTEWFLFNNPSSKVPENTPPKETPLTPGAAGPITIPPTTTTQTTVTSTSTGGSGSGGSTSGGQGGAQTSSTLSINSVTPTEADSNSSTRTTVTGSGFKQALKLRLGDIGLQFNVIDDQTITFTVQEMGPGTYDLIISGANSEAVKKGAVTITGAPQSYNAQGY